MAGIIFYDLDNDGCQETGENNVSQAVTVSLFECNGATPGNGTFITSTTTINGAYTFGQGSPNTNADVCLIAGTDYYVVFDISKPVFLFLRSSESKIWSSQNVEQARAEKQSRSVESKVFGHKVDEAR